MFDDLTSSSLLAPSKLVDDGCDVILNKNYAIVLKNDKVQVLGPRNFNDSLWDIPIPIKHSNPTSQINNVSTINNHKLNIILKKDQSKITLAQYHHHTLFAPTENTLRRAIRNHHLVTWPGLTQDLISNGFTKSAATAKGHLHQERQGLQSTKSSTLPSTTTLLQQATTVKPRIKHEDDEDDYFPTPEQPNIKTTNVMYSIIDTHKLGQASMDLTGRFPYMSRRGNQYILIGYHYDANYIAAVPLKRRTAGEITKAWTTLHSKFCTTSFTPSTYIMDNETSKELLTALTKQKINYQLAPPHMHRTNSAERAIQTFKNHFIAGLNVCNSQFPVAEWDHLLPQAKITLNLL